MLNWEKTKALVLGLSFFVLLGLEQAVKYSIRQPFKNYFFAFGLPLPPALIYLVNVTVLAGIGVYLYKHYKQFKFSQELAWLLVLTGAISNFGERIILGFVRDYIYIAGGIFNLADLYIIVGVVILLAQSARRKT